MRIDKEFRPELIVSDDVTRTSINHAQLDTGAGDDKAYLVATNGHSLVAVPVVTEDDDTAGPIASDAIIAARKAMPKRSADVQFKANGCYVLANGTTIPRPESDSQFPQWRDVVPPYTAGTEGTMSISFNAQLLLQLARAMGDEHVMLTFPAHSAGDDMRAPIRVQHRTDPRVFGVLMPCRR